MLFILNRDFEVVAVANNQGTALPYYADNHTQNLEAGSSSYEFTVPTTHEDADKIVEGNYVVRTDLDGKHLMFTIMNIEETHAEDSEKVVYCEDAGLELMNEVEVAYKETTAKDIKHYINKAISATGWTIGYCDVDATRTLEFTEDENILARILRIASEFNAEISFSVKLSGMSVSKRYVNIYEQRGEDNGKRFVYSKDIKSIRRTVNMDNVATAIYAVGKTDDKGKTTYIDALTYDKDDIYTESGSKYLYNRDALKRWGQQGGNIHYIFRYETSKNTELLNRAITELKKRENPLITYEVDVALLERLAGYEEEQVRIGDTVKVIDYSFTPELYLEARIVELETSYTDPSQDKAVLGNYKVVKSDISSTIRAMQSKLMQKEATWDASMLVAEQAKNEIDKMGKVDLKFWGRALYNSDLVVKNPAKPIYGASGKPNPPIGAVFNNFNRVNKLIVNDIDTPATAWTLIDMVKMYKVTGDELAKTTAIQIADFLASHMIEASFYGAIFHAMPNAYVYDEVNGWMPKTNFIHIRTFYHTAWALLEAYGMTGNETYKTKAQQLFDGVSIFHENIKQRAGTEIASFMAGAEYNTINSSDGYNFAPEWTTFATTTGDVIHYAVNKYLELIGDETRVNGEGISYTISGIKSDNAGFMLNAYNNHGLRKPDGHNLLYCFYKFDWSDAVDANGLYVPKAIMWDFLEDVYDIDTWFTGDLQYWAIQSFVLAGQTEIASSLLNRFYELRVPNTGENILFHDRYDRDGHHLESDDSISIVFTALFLKGMKGIGIHDYDQRAIQTLRQFQIKDASLILDGTYSWDANSSTSHVEMKSLGEILYAPIETISTALNFDQALAESINFNQKLDEKLTDNINGVADTVGNIDARTTDVEIIKTVIYAEDFTSILSDKANVEDISDMATGEQLKVEIDNTTKYIDGRLDGEGGINESINAVSSALEKTANSINAKFTSSGGVNLIKNSIGYAGKDFWTVSGVVDIEQTTELEKLGFGSGWKTTIGTAGYLEQTITVEPNKKHSLSFWIKKSKDAVTDANAGVEIYANGVKLAFVGLESGSGLSANEAKFDYVLGLYTFQTEFNEVTVRVAVDSQSEAIITGLMLNIGEDAFQWQHANGEVYNTNVQMNLNGLKVISSTYKGYTIMSDKEFSGYAEIIDEVTGKPTMVKVFTLNQDTTEVTKIQIDKEINMSPVKVIPIISATSNGWAWIPSE